MIAMTIAAALLTPAQSPTVPYGQKKAERDIRVVVEAFRTAIMHRDRAAFLALFRAGPVVWQSVNSDALAARSVRRVGIDAKAAFDERETPASFIEKIMKERQRSEERYANLAIDSDGDIASVTFDFVYLLDDRPINVGKEAWHLVRTERGWKIASVIYSNRDPDTRARSRVR